LTVLRRARDNRAVGRLVVLALLALVATPAGAEAAAPGTNGRIAFLSNRGGGGYGLYTMRADGGDVRLVTAKVDTHSPPAWSPSGDRIVFTTTAGSRLATIGPGGAGRHVFPFIGWWGTWSTGGGYIAYENEADGIDIVAAAGGTPTRLLEDQGAGDLSKWQPSWSPSGARVAYTSGSGDHSGAIWTVRSDGRDPRRVTNGDRRGEIDLAPDWSPNGKAIAFQRYVNCAGGRCANAVYVVPAGGGVPKLVVKNAASPSWSPDGRKIAFVRRSGASDIWVVNADGTGAHRVTTSPASDLAPDWQPRR